MESTSSILKGSYSQKAVFMCKVCSQNTDTSTLRLQNLKVILLWFMKVLLTSECAKTIFPQSSNFKVSAESSQCMIDYLMSTMREDASVDISPGEQVSPDKLEEWMVSTPLAVQILETIFAFVFYYRIIIKGTAMPSDIMTYFGIELNPETGKVIPDRLIFPLKSQHPLFRESFDSKLLDQSLLMFLNSYFPHSLRGRFFPLFSSSHHGESFSTFCKSLVGCSGPTLLVIRDKKGHVFGGFASTVWRNDPNFIGLCSLYSYIRMYICVYLCACYVCIYVHVMCVSMCMLCVYLCACYVCIYVHVMCVSMCMLCVYLCACYVCIYVHVMCVSMCMLCVYLCACYVCIYVHVMCVSMCMLCVYLCACCVYLCACYVCIYVHVMCVSMCMLCVYLCACCVYLCACYVCLYVCYLCMFIG